MVKLLKNRANKVEMVYLGDKVEVLINVNPIKTIDISEIIVRVDCIRSYWNLNDFLSTGDMSNYRSRRRSSGRTMPVDTVDRREVSISGKTLHKGQPEKLMAEIFMPAEGMLTDSMGPLKVRWYLTVFLQGPSGFSAGKRMEINVVGKKRKASQPSAGALISLTEEAPDKPDFKLCMSCGTKNSQQVKFCINCGEMLG